MAQGFSAREVAELADVPVRAVDKAVEERILSAMANGKHGRRRDLPLHAIPYTALIARLPITLSLSTKKQIARALGKRSSESMTRDPLQIGTAITVDVATLIGKDMAHRAERYGQAREDLIDIDAEVMGGTPVIRGTRLTVYAVLGRLNGGDSISDLLEDYPHLTAEAVETAAIYARTHPPLGRPAGRPWTHST